MYSNQFFKYLASSKAFKNSIFFNKLQGVTNDALLKNPLLMSLIEIRWERIQIGIIYLELLPYFVFLISVYIYTIEDLVSSIWV